MSSTVITTVRKIGELRRVTVICVRNFALRLNNLTNIGRKSRHKFDDDLSEKTKEPCGSGFNDSMGFYVRAV